MQQFFSALWKASRRNRASKTNAEQAAKRLAALNRVGIALAQELDEPRLLHLIAETACSLTGAGFAAFTLRPIDELGQPLVPSEGNLFRLAAVVGVSKEQERLLERLALGGEGLLAPIFRQGVPVRVHDALTHIVGTGYTPEQAQEGLIESRKKAREAAFAFAHGRMSKEQLRSLGIPPGHPIVRSFLGAPLFDRSRQVRGGLLLGHEEPGCFTAEDEELLVALAAQATVALENARLYRSAQMHAKELDAIFESIADGVLLVDSKGNILRENAAARRIRETLAPCPKSEEALERMLYRPAQRAIQEEEAQGIPIDIVDQQGETRAYHVTASPLRLAKDGDVATNGDMPISRSMGSVSGVVIAWHDVTETRHLMNERQARAEAEARRGLLQLVLDELPISVYLVRGQDARLVLANHAAETVWSAVWPQGQPMQTFLEQNEIGISDTDGQPLPTTKLATIRAVQQGETVRQHQEIIRHADGSSLPVLVNAVALDAHKLRLSDEQGKTGAQDNEAAAIVVHQDVTALKEAEQIKDDFIGIAAHELRTPLAVLKGFAQTLIVQSAKGRGPQLIDWQIEALQGIDQATSRLVELTEDLLDVTRLQAGRLKLLTEPLDLIALARRVVARLQMTTERHQLSMHTDDEYLIVDVDRQRIEQVLSNLIGNGIKYSPDGGPVEITLSQDQETHMALMIVSDRGIGIPSMQQRQIFGRFIRADNASAQGIGGTGLGLYLCRELVERQGGRIWFESEEGQGSKFFVTLPLLSTGNQE
jgi:signal transduction histidine kinase/GAF domain-containing protein